MERYGPLDLTLSFLPPTSTLPPGRLVLSLATDWRNARQRFPDVSPGHLTYPAASLAVEAGVMQVLEDGSFQLARPVTGAEAVAAVKKLQDLAESTAR